MSVTTTKRSKAKSKNNFTDPNVVEKVKYILWICHNSEGCKKYPKTKTWKGFVSKKDGGLQSLKNLVIKKRPLIELARIYDTATNTIVPGCDWNFKH